MLKIWKYWSGPNLAGVFSLCPGEIASSLKFIDYISKASVDFKFWKGLKVALSTQKSGFLGSRNSYSGVMGPWTHRDESAGEPGLCDLLSLCANICVGLRHVTVSSWRRPDTHQCLKGAYSLEQWEDMDQGNACAFPLLAGCLTGILQCLSLQASPEKGMAVRGLLWSPVRTSPLSLRYVSHQHPQRALLA